MMNSRMLAVVLILLAAALGVGSAGAQDAAVGEGSQSTVLEEIVVTAQKRSENLRTVPLAVSVLTNDQLEKQDLRSINQIAAQIPGLYVGTPYSDAIPIFSLRGVSAVDFSQNQSSPIALYVDEAYKGLPVFTSLQLFDLERVEVLRGPQGTLFGRNATGGAVSAHTIKPDVDDGIHGYISGDYGRFDRRSANGGVNIPFVSGKAAGRLAFTLTEVDGFVENLYPGQPDGNAIDDWAVRGSLAFVPTDSVGVQFRYTRSRSKPTGYVYFIDEVGAAGPGGAGFGTGYSRQGLEFFETETDRVGRVDIKNQSAALEINWDITGEVELTSISSFEDGEWLTEEDADGTPFNLVHDDYVSDARSYAQDVRLASTGVSPFQWLVGGYYYRDRVDAGVTLRFYYEFAGDNDLSGTLDCFEDGFTGCGYSNKMAQRRESFALYTQNSYEFDNGITLTGGLRYTEDDSDLDSYEAFLQYLDPETGEEVLRALQTISESPVDALNSDNISFKAGVSYEFNDGTFVYLNASSGYRNGAFNGQALFDPSEITIAEPEKLTAYEVGLKTDLVGNRMRIQTAAFYYDYEDQQFIDVTPETLQLLVSAKESRLWGAEFESTTRLNRSLDVRLAATYLNSEYKDVILQSVDVSGNQLILAPEWTFTGGLSWQAYTGDFGSIAIDTHSRYNSRLFYDAFNTAATSQEPYWVHDARVTYTSPSEAISISAWVKNMLDEEYLTYRFALTEGFNFNIAQYGRPREYGLQATFRF